MDKDIILWIMGIAITVCSGVVGSLYSRVTGLSDRVAALETKIEPFWNILGAKAAKILHQPHHTAKELDTLLEKFLREELSVGEFNKFITILRRIEDSKDESAGRRLAASILLIKTQQSHEN